MRHCSKHQLKAKDHFIKLIGAKLGIRLAKIGPGVNVVSHQLDRIAVDVVIEPDGDGTNVVIVDLTGIEF